MHYSISELMDMSYIPAEYELDDPAITTASRMEKMTLDVLHASVCRHPRRIGRTLMIAAVIALLLLAFGALAVYHYGLKDAVIENVGPLPAQTDEKKTYLSLNGYSDSPECMAYTEWSRWNNEWTSEHTDRYEKLGVDDMWYETPENYARLYGAPFAEQAEKLDEIIEKYGLTLHTERRLFSVASDLYGALGTVPFIAAGYTIYGDYYYDDGSFKACGYPDEAGRDSFFEIVTAVKGSFMQGMLVLREDAVEQEYTTAGGTSIILFTEKSSDRMGFISSSEGCYVTAVIHTDDEQQAKAFADAVDFGAIAALFATPQSRAATAASVAAYDVGSTAAESVEEQFVQSVAEDYEALSVSEVYYSLGCYAPKLPAGYGHTGDTAYKRTGHFEESSGQVISRYFRADQDDYIRLSYKRFSTEDVSDLESTRAEFDAEREYRNQFGITVDQSVNGYEGYFSDVLNWKYADENQQRNLDWLDTDRGIWFILTCSVNIGDEALLALAESVTEAEVPEHIVLDVSESEETIQEK